MFSTHFNSSYIRFVPFNSDFCLLFLRFGDTVFWVGYQSLVDQQLYFYMAFSLWHLYPVYNIHRVCHYSFPISTSAIGAPNGLQAHYRNQDKIPASIHWISALTVVFCSVIPWSHINPIFPFHPSGFTLIVLWSVPFKILVIYTDNLPSYSMIIFANPLTHSLMNYSYSQIS